MNDWSEYEKNSIIEMKVEFVQRELDWRNVKECHCVRSRSIRKEQTRRKKIICRRQKPKTGSVQIELNRKGGAEMNAAHKPIRKEKLERLK